MCHLNATRRETLKTIAMVSIVAVLMGSKALDPRKSTRSESDKRTIGPPGRHGRFAKVMTSAVDPGVEGSR
jgi:hypothetical protein